MYIYMAENLFRELETTLWFHTGFMPLVETAVSYPVSWPVFACLVSYPVSYPASYPELGLGWSILIDVG